MELQVFVFVNLCGPEGQKCNLGKALFTAATISQKWLIFLLMNFHGKQTQMDVNGL
jgi:hypothetical protein